MCDRHDLVLLEAKRLLNLRYVNSPAKLGTQLVDFSAVRLKAESEHG